MTSFNWLQNSLTSLFIFIIQFYSKIIIYFNKNLPLFAKFSNRAFYLLDSFFSGKFIEPYHWVTCISFFTPLYPLYIDNIHKIATYNEFYDNATDNDIIIGLDKYLFLAKYNSLILSKVNAKPLATESIPCKNPFLSIIYKYQNDEVEFDIPKKYFVKDNEILSDLFVARYLKHHFPQVSFDSNYILKIIDCDLKLIILNSNSYILLDKDSYSIVYDQPKTPTTSNQTLHIN